MIVDAVSYLWSAFFVFLIRRPEPPGRAARRGGARTEALDAPGDLGRPALRDRAPLAAGDRRHDRHLELLRQRHGRDPDPVRDPRARPLPGGHRVRVLDRVDGRPARRARRRAGSPRAWASGGRSWRPRSGSASRACRSRSRRTTRSSPPWRCSGSPAGSSASRGTSTRCQLRQAITPPRMQGRMNATMRFIVWGTIPLGAIIGGALGGHHRPARDDLGGGDRRAVRVPAGGPVVGAADRDDARAGRRRRDAGRPGDHGSRLS